MSNLLGIGTHKIYTVLILEKTIIPVAGGKGGVGKSFFSANLAIALAEMGHTTIAVDLDLGGSNLYSFLGVPNRFPGIGDYLKARGAELPELLVSIDTPNLQFLPGDGLSPFMANIPYAQKLRLMSHLTKLPARYIVLDLGAGTSFNTLDFFRLSPHGLVVTTPEYPAVMNMLSFLKHLVLRSVEGNFKKDNRILKMLHSLYKQPIDKQRSLMESLRSGLSAIDPTALQKLSEICGRIRPRIIFNMGEHPDEMEVCEQIDKNLASSLSLGVDYFGFVFNDSAVRHSIKNRTPFLPSYRNNMTAKCVGQIAERIVKYWDRQVKDSAARIHRHACDIYESRNVSQFSV